MNKSFSRAVIASMFMMLIASIVISCAGTAGGIGGGSDTALSVSLPDNRALWSKSEVQFFTVTISSSSYKETKSAAGGETITFSSIPVGIYNVNAIGKNSKGDITAKGTATVEIIEGENTSTTVVLQRLECCTVTFHSKDASGNSVVYATKTVTQGYTVVAPAGANVGGKTFSFWTDTDGGTTPFDFTTPISSDIDLYAAFDMNIFSITYNSTPTADGLTGFESYDCTIGLTLPEPTSTGLTFAGWYENATFSGTAVTSIPVGAAGAKTFYAKWTATVTIYDYVEAGSGYGTLLDTQTVVYNDCATAPATDPTRAGYAFAGWQTGNADEPVTFTFTTPITGNKTVYGKWNPPATSFNGTLAEFLTTEFDTGSSSSSPFSITITDIADGDLNSFVARIKEIKDAGNQLYFSLDLSGCTGLTELGSLCFSGSIAPSQPCARGLKSITLPNTVTTIEANAFYDCDLSSITLSSTLNSIGKDAFAYCENLTSVTVPASVQSIYRNAFCLSGVTSITFEGTNNWCLNGSGAPSELNTTLMFLTNSDNLNSNDYYQRVE